MLKRSALKEYKVISLSDSPILMKWGNFILIVIHTINLFFVRILYVKFK
jgi:hypothetical protein